MLVDDGRPVLPRERVVVDVVPSTVLAHLDFDEVLKRVAAALVHRHNEHVDAHETVGEDVDCILHKAEEQRTERRGRCMRARAV